MLVNNWAPDNAPSLGKAKRLQQPTHLTAPAPDCDRDIRHDQNGDQEDDLEVDQEGGSNCSKNKGVSGSNTPQWRPHAPRNHFLLRSPPIWA